MKYKGYKWWRFIVTWCMQPSGAPLVDSAYSRDAEGVMYNSRVLYLRPWRRRNQHGERPPGPGLVVGWRQ